MKHAKRDVLMLVIVIFMVLSGCDPANEKADVQFNMGINNRVSESDSFIFYISNQDGKMQIIAQDKVTGNRYRAIRNPFETVSFRVDTPFYVHGNSLYYVKVENIHTQGGVLPGKLSIIEIDLETYDERVIYDEDIRLQKDTFLGLMTTAKNNTSHGITRFFLYNQNIYMLDSFTPEGSGISRINMRTKEKETLIHSPTSITQLAFDGSHIYYVDHRLRNVMFNVETKETTVIPDVLTRYIILLNNELFFINAKDNGAIYAMDLKDFSLRKITENAAYSFHGDEQHIYYANEDDNHYLYRIDFDGKNNKKMAEIPSYGIAVFQNHTELHVMSDIGTYVVNKETIEVDLLE